jgi:hypothetical protein
VRTLSNLLASTHLQVVPHDDDLFYLWSFGCFHDLFIRLVFID